MRNALIAIFGFSLAACTSAPPAVIYPQSPPRVQNVTERSLQGPFQPDYYLNACSPSFANRPPTSRAGRVLNYNALVVKNGVLLAASPVNGACMTSGFGPRFGSMHKGIDLQAKPAVQVYSAAPGTILEVSRQTGFGNQVLIEHGSGVYTRYAHLANFAPGLTPGEIIGFGQPLGLMGATGNATAIHLHYEVLTGNYDTPRKSWGLTAHNPLDLPRWSGLDQLG